MNEQIFQNLLRLYPDIENENQYMLPTLIDVTTTIAKNDGLTGDKLNLGISLLILDILFPTHSDSGVASRKIDNVSETYVTSYISSRWKRLYDMLINGAYDGSITLYYDGVS